MPALKNARHEVFAQGVAKGMSATEAYEKAGYKPHQPSASRLLSNAMVEARNGELKAKAAKRAEVTIESLADELDEARALALGEKQASAAIAATMGKAKLYGKLVEKRQHSGTIGTIDPTKLKGMSNEELDLLERAMVQIGIASGDPGGEGGEED